MAGPNLIGATTITGKIATSNATTTSANLVANPTSSSKVLKLNLLYVSNANTSTAANVNVEVFRGAVGYGLIMNGTVPVGGALTIVDKSLYLEEGDAVRITASANGIIQAVCSYEEIV